MPFATANRKAAEVPVDVSCDVEGARRYVRVMRGEALRLLGLVGLKNSELSVLLTGDRRIKELNRDFRHKNRATDVLSFAQIEAIDGDMRANPLDPLEAGVIGDVVISLETAARQADKMGQDVERRLRTLLVHGVLHLLGYDHERSADDAKLMFGYQAELEARLEAGGRGARRATRSEAR
ncbi:MAG: rRNA maturation RNase YbeY [Candidatus Binataceae bacterium]